ncbi:hypothetical protein JT151_01765 [Helicobacter pylori]|uniref:hypothetical protein n=1 Tax=Helicobacter pylori TaxID=210 RepID=UPI0002BC1B1C|nr:hypothetical protein [Helicobacter pylori]MCQ2721520.1 hypothetical protein [Helicobacter pylori]MCQ2727259.1 hypothetical protein [Helicobacter pylori]MDO7808967.1 hypothetical protein [Helicobacter pylori]MDO7815335.1 hypothetical protein [Helicobacter pylori]MDO7819810.1 hypothetical protein [Helicobacter pylori]
MNYPNLPNSALEITQQPEVKEITNELLKQLQNALHSNTHFSEQVGLSLKGIVRILEVLLSLDFFKNANEIDSSLRNSIDWLSNAGESLKLKMKEYENFFSEFNTSMHANEQEVTDTLNANAENIKSEIKKLENQMIETTTRLLKQETQKSVKAYNAMMGHQPQNSLKHGLKNFNNPLSKEG